MNISNVLSTMWIVSQGAPFIVVHFKADNYESKRLWQDKPFPIAVFTYSDVEPLVRLSREALKSKLWILVIVDNEPLCYHSESNGANHANELPSNCTVRRKLTEENIAQMEHFVEYLTLTRWLIPRDTPIEPWSDLLCFVTFDDFTDVPSDYRECVQRRKIQPGETYQPHINYLSVIDFGLSAYTTGFEEEIRQFLNLSWIFTRHYVGVYYEPNLWMRLRLRWADMIIDDFVMTSSRVEEVSFSSPVCAMMTDFLSKRRTSRALGSLGIVNVFDRGTWICVCLLLTSFYTALRILKHPAAFIVVIATQLNLSLDVTPRLLGLIMFTSGFFLNCAFSSGLLSSLNTLHDPQIATLENLATVLNFGHTKVCISNVTFLRAFIDDPGRSALFRIMARKKHEGKLILSTREDCHKQTRSSGDVISVLTSPSFARRVNRLYVGKEAIYVSTAGYPISPGYPLRKQVNQLIGNLREMNIIAKRHQTLMFNETMAELQRTEKTTSTKTLTISDFKLFLFALAASELIGCVIQAYMLSLNYEPL